MHHNGIHNVRYAAAPPTFVAPPLKETAAQANGRRYDEKVASYVRHWASKNAYEYKDHPWISYQDSQSRLHFCQPDYLLLSQDSDNLMIIEAKLRHTRDAIAQLQRYRTLIQLIHPEYKPSLVEICRYFDPDEYRMEVLDDLRPHNLNYAALVFEPRAWTQATN